ncbi:hypothetical protein [Pseudidiomarina terrestris]|uniref:MSHA biogenesis protein MshI n=1 Tax=Pseudidiomarina terrestris TaxID=2820060 RepID=A0ABT8MHN5_9GAMM|nr:MULTISPECIES: hypothetical protein [unclassified Pseudidiomarina]MDN7129445.1 hypothetical protein [Pseudidiomarina sp. 1APR75-15]MDN7134290.1 hypothetical protein [Pseudidiomarina sp. 1ASP75-5]MDN7137022.1 hypothetical protein [Pseudidiomarina sp. 1ASP75-14]MEA3587916.1 hypothetical protein [Pseudidiomarina sp. 1APP75-27a]
MKTFANLYVPELRPNREWLTLQRFVVTAVSLIAVFVVAWLVLKFIAGQQQAAFVASVTQANQIEVQLRQRQAALEQALNDSSLNEELESVQHRLTLRQRLLVQMQQLTGRNSVSFSQLLVDLAAADEHAIWLHRILLQDQALTLQGVTLEPQQLPAWLADFSQYPTLKDRPFGVFELRDEGERGLRFTVGHLQHSRDVQAVSGSMQ